MYSIDTNKVFWRRVEDETVILDIDTGFYYTLNEVGSDIWDMIADKKNEDQITNEIIGIYDAEEKTARKDIKRILSMLVKENLIN